MRKHLIQLIVGTLCLLAPALKTAAQTGLQAFQLSGWGYPTGYTESGGTFSFGKYAGAIDNQSFFHIKCRFPARTFLVARTNVLVVATSPSLDS